MCRQVIFCHINSWLRKTLGKGKGASLSWSPLEFPLSFLGFRRILMGTSWNLERLESELELAWKLQWAFNTSMVHAGWKAGMDPDFLTLLEEMELKKLMGGLKCWPRFHRSERRFKIRWAFKYDHWFLWLFYIELFRTQNVARLGTETPSGDPSTKSGIGSYRI